MDMFKLTFQWSFVSDDIRGTYHLLGNSYSSSELHYIPPLTEGNSVYIKINFEEEDAELFCDLCNQDDVMMYMVTRNVICIHGPLEDNYLNLSSLLLKS